MTGRNLEVKKKQNEIDWKVTDPVWDNMHRRPGLADARENPDFHKTFEELVAESGNEFECNSRVNYAGYNQRLFRIRAPGLAADAPVAFL